MTNSDDALSSEWLRVRTCLHQVYGLPGEMGSEQRALQIELEKIELTLGPSKYLQLEEDFRVTVESRQEQYRPLPPLAPRQSSRYARRAQRVVLLGLGWLLVAIGVPMLFLLVKGHPETVRSSTPGSVLGEMLATGGIAIVSLIVGVWLIKKSAKYSG